MSDACVLWTGTLAPDGYGRLSRGTGTRLAHRYLYEQEHGPLPASVHLHHVCGVKACVNLAHLEPLTALEHKRLHHKTHCVNGHALTPENVYVWRDTRKCRTCGNAATARWWRARKAASCAS